MKVIWKYIRKWFNFSSYHLLDIINININDIKSTRNKRGRKREFMCLKYFKYRSLTLDCIFWIDLRWQYVKKLQCHSQTFCHSQTSFVILHFRYGYDKFIYSNGKLLKLKYWCALKKTKKNRIYWLNFMNRHFTKLLFLMVILVAIKDLFVQCFVPFFIALTTHARYLSFNPTYHIIGLVKQKNWLFYQLLKEIDGFFRNGVILIRDGFWFLQMS